MATLDQLMSDLVALASDRGGALFPDGVDAHAVEGRDFVDTTLVSFEGGPADLTGATLTVRAYDSIGGPVAHTFTGAAGLGYLQVTQTGPELAGLAGARTGTRSLPWDAYLAAEGQTVQVWDQTISTLYVRQGD